MTVADKSMFDAPLGRPPLLPGLRMGMNWHFNSKPIWSNGPHSYLNFSRASFPTPKGVALNLSVFNAAPETPKELRIESPGHAPVSYLITTNEVCSVRVDSPVHADGALGTDITLILEDIDSPAKIGLSPDDRLLGVSIASAMLLDSLLALPLSFGEEATCQALLGDGWAAPDIDMGVWTVGPAATLTLPGYLCTVPATKLAFDLMALPRPEDMPPLAVSVTRNGKVLVRWEFEQDAQGPWYCPLGTWQPGSDLELGFIIENAQSPQSLDINTDPRPLGIQLQQLHMVNASIQNESE